MTDLTNFPVPTGLPTLASGPHAEGSGQACVMEYVSILAGEKFSDSPACTDAVLAAAARNVNDYMTDEGRHLLVPMIGRLFGTAERGSTETSVKLAEFAVEYVQEKIKNRPTGVNGDQVLAEYMTALLDKFDELTGFVDQESTKLAAEDLKKLSDAVTSRTNA